MPERCLHEVNRRAPGRAHGKRAPEPKTFAESFTRALNTAGISATSQEWLIAETQVVAKDEAFAKLLGDLIARASGRPTMTLTIADPRGAVVREEAANGTMVHRGVPNAYAYVEIGIRLARRGSQ